MVTIESLDRKLAAGHISTDEYWQQLNIINLARNAHEEIESWYARVASNHSSNPFEYTLPHTTLPARWATTVWNESAKRAYDTYGENWNFNKQAWDELIPFYEDRCRSLEVQRAIEEGVAEVDPWRAHMMGQS